jgi:hypothetical protein
LDGAKAAVPAMREAKTAVFMVKSSEKSARMANLFPVVDLQLTFR